MRSAWAGALVALAFGVQQIARPHLPAVPPLVMLAVFAAIVLILTCLRYAKGRRGVVLPLCFLLGVLFTCFSVGLTIWSSSLPWRP